MTLAEFRRLAVGPPPAASAKKKMEALVPVNYRQADEAFLRILLIQARIAAARQSLDRLAGWNKAIQPRVEVQSIAALDVEILALAEKTAASEVAKQEADLRHAVAVANQLVGRAAATPLAAIIDAPAADSPDAAGLNSMEKEVLTRGRDLLVKLFQSYSVGGIDLTELLWYERQAAEAESNYRGWAARSGFATEADAAGQGR